MVTMESKTPLERTKKIFNVQNGEGETTEKKTTDLYLASLPINWTMHLSVITGMGKKTGDIHRLREK